MPSIADLQNSTNYSTLISIGDVVYRKVLGKIELKTSKNEKGAFLLFIPDQPTPNCPIHAFDLYSIKKTQSSVAGSRTCLLRLEIEQNQIASQIIFNFTGTSADANKSSLIETYKSIISSSSALNDQEKTKQNAENLNLQNGVVSHQSPSTTLVNAISIKKDPFEPSQSTQHSSFGVQESSNVSTSFLPSTAQTRTHISSLDQLDESKLYEELFESGILSREEISDSQTPETILSSFGHQSSKSDANSMNIPNLSMSKSLESDLQAGNSFFDLLKKNFVNGRLTLVLTQSLRYQIFLEYPFVKETYHEWVPSRMSHAHFWEKFLKSQLQKMIRKQKEKQLETINRLSKDIKGRQKVKLKAKEASKEANTTFSNFEDLNEFEALTDHPSTFKTSLKSNSNILATNGNNALDSKAKQSNQQQNQSKTFANLNQQSKSSLSSSKSLSLSSFKSTNNSNLSNMIDPALINFVQITKDDFDSTEDDQADTDIKRRRHHQDDDEDDVKKNAVNVGDKTSKKSSQRQIGSQNQHDNDDDGDIVAVDDDDDDGGYSKTELGKEKSRRARNLELIRKFNRHGEIIVSSSNTSSEHEDTLLNQLASPLASLNLAESVKINSNQNSTKSDQNKFATIKTEPIQSNSSNYYIPNLNESEDQKRGQIAEHFNNLHHSSSNASNHIEDPSNYLSSLTYIPELDGIGLGIENVEENQNNFMATSSSSAISNLMYFNPQYDYIDIKNEMAADYHGKHEELKEFEIEFLKSISTRKDDQNEKQNTWLYYHSDENDESDQLLMKRLMLTLEGENLWSNEIGDEMEACSFEQLVNLMSKLYVILRIFWNMIEGEANQEKLKKSFDFFEFSGILKRSNEKMEWTDQIDTIDQKMMLFDDDEAQKRFALKILKVFLKIFEIQKILKIQKTIFLKRFKAKRLAKAKENTFYESNINSVNQIMMINRYLKLIERATSKLN